jgi:hypothetical protein
VAAYAPTVLPGVGGMGGAGVLVTPSPLSHRIVRDLHFVPRDRFVLDARPGR